MEIKDKVLDGIVGVTGDNFSRENANINAATPSGIMMKFASATGKQYAHDYLISDEAREAMDNNLIHIHDFDYYSTRSLTCLQHPLDKVLNGGFSASDGTARPAKRIETATALAAISIQTITNEQHGGQAFAAWDYYMAPYVKMTYLEELEKVAQVLDKSVDLIAHAVSEYEYEENAKEPWKIAVNNTVKRVHQAMEAFIHNMNTMRSRGGGQVPFSSINFGTDTTPEGRLVIRETLQCTYDGVGNGQTAIFPISIFKVKNGINAHKGDPNYDLLEFATKVTAKRYFPNYIFLDAPFNVNEKWREDDLERYKYECATMG